MTQLSDILNEEKLADHISKGNVSYRLHPTLPLVIYNYTPQAAFAKCWGDGTIDFCRGLIVDVDTKRVIARPFKKFHNLNTSFVPETMEANLPNVAPIITEKMDGSLGIFYRYGREWGIASRGSFESPQAKWATEWYKRQVEEGRLYSFSGVHVTPLFEIVYPENRIVCKYDFEGLVLLGFIDVNSGQEGRADLLGPSYGFEGKYLVKTHETTLKTILSENEPNREGYVLTYTLGHKSPLKVKIKFDDYCQMHKIVTGVSPLAIWQSVSSGEDMSFLADAMLPEHYFIWATKWVDRLRDQFVEIHRICSQIFFERPAVATRRQIAEYFNVSLFPIVGGNKYLGILFSMLDGKPKEQIESSIWRLVKPRGDDQSFRKDGE